MTGALDLEGEKRKSSGPEGKSRFGLKGLRYASSRRPEVVVFLWANHPFLLS